MLIDKKSLLEHGEFEKIICAALNEGGAYILTGVENSNVVTGHILSQDEKSKIEETFTNCMSFITPKVQYPEVVLEFVPVFKYPEENQEGHYLIRTKVNPKHQKRTYFIKN